MKKRIFTSLLVLLVLCLSLSVTAFAETTPLEGVTPTEDVFATEEPVYPTDPIDTTPQTDPYYPTEPYDTEPIDTTPSDYTEPSTGESTAPLDTTAPSSTAPHTNPPEPTEPDEDSTYSDYVSPEPIYTPADQDFEDNDWKEIKLNIDSAPSNGKGTFDFIQKNNTKGNDSIAGFLIAGIVLIFLSIAGFTFVIVYRPFKKKAPAKAGARYAEKEAPKRRSSQNRSTSKTRENRRPYNPDDYNDGF